MRLVLWREISAKAGRLALALVFHHPWARKRRTTKSEPSELLASRNLLQHVWNPGYVEGGSRLASSVGARFMSTRRAVFVFLRSRTFCLDGESSFQVRMDRPGAMAVLRRDQFESPQHIPSVLWSEARAQGALSRHVRVRGSPGETWEDAVDLPDGCHRVVAFGRGAVLSVHSQEEPLRQRRVEGWSQVLFCGAGERRLKLRFLAPASDVRLFLGDV